MKSEKLVSACLERILRYGFETAMKRPRKLLASATKS